MSDGPFRIQMFNAVGDQRGTVAEIWVDLPSRSECLALVFLRDRKPVVVFGGRKPFPELPALEFLATYRRAVDLLLAEI